MRFTTYCVCLHVLVEERREVKYLVRRPLPASRANFELSEKNERLLLAAGDCLLFRFSVMSQPTERTPIIASVRHRHKRKQEMCQTVRHQKVHVRSWQL